MAAHADQKQFVDYLVELMQSIGPVTARRMFGVHGLFLDGLMFGLVADSTLYLKVDTQSEPAFVDQGLEAFSYAKNGRPCRLSYRQAPPETLEDIEQMNVWANRAYEAAMLAAAKKRRE